MSLAITPRPVSMDRPSLVSSLTRGVLAPSRLKDCTERQKAITEGKFSYFTGKPCIRGHIAYRQIANNTCRQCLVDRKKSQSPEKKRELYLKARPRTMAWLQKIYKKRDELATHRKPDTCEICKRTPKEGKLNTRLVFDHCHKANKFRGWLCGRCNQALGLLEENPEILQSMTHYINDFKKREEAICQIPDSLLFTLHMQSRRASGS